MSPSPQTLLDRSLLSARPRLRLFCFPHAGSGVAGYALWNQQLPRDVQVCAVRLPGRDNRLREAAFAELPELVEAFCEELRLWDGCEFAIFGHSLGALAGFEIARQLRRTGQPGPKCLFLSSFSAPQSMKSYPPLHRLPNREFLREIAVRYDGVPAAILDDEQLVELYAPILKADFGQLVAYDYRPEPPLTCPFVALYGNLDRQVERGDMAGWAEHTTGPFRFHEFPGDHFYLRPCRDSLLRTLTAEIQQLIS